MGKNNHKDLTENGLVLQQASLQLNKYEISRYFLQNFQYTTLLIQMFSKISEHEIVLQECKSKQKQFHVHNFYKINILKEHSYVY